MLLGSYPDSLAQPVLWGPASVTCGSPTSSPVTLTPALGPLQSPLCFLAPCFAWHGLLLWWDPFPASLCSSVKAPTIRSNSLQCFLPCGQLLVFEAEHTALRLRSHSFSCMLLTEFCSSPWFCNSLLVWLSPLVACVDLRDKAQVYSWLNPQIPARCVDEKNECTLNAAILSKDHSGV